MIDTIVFPLPQPYHPDSPVRFRNVTVEPSVDGYLPTALNESSRRPDGVIPPLQRIAATFAAANQSGSDCSLFVRPGVAGEQVGGYVADGVLTIPSMPGETTGSGSFIMDRRSGPLTDLLFRIFPSGQSSPEYRILQPIDITIDAPGFPRSSAPPGLAVLSLSSGREEPAITHGCCAVSNWSAGLR